MKYFNTELANFKKLKSMVDFMYHQKNVSNKTPISEATYIRNYIQTHMHEHYELENVDKNQLYDLLVQKEKEWDDLQQKRDEEFTSILAKFNCSFPAYKLFKSNDIQIKQDNSDIIIQTSDEINYFCEIKMTLHEAFSPSIFSVSIVMHYELEMKDNVAHLTILFEYPNMDDAIPLNIYFTSCDIEAIRYPLFNTGYFDPKCSFAFTFNKLQYLQFVKDFGFELNPMEERLYKVTPEIKNIRSFKNEDCPNFKQLASELGFDLSKIKPKDLLFKLSERTYLPLAEKIEAMIEESQKDYIPAAEIKVDKEYLKTVRERITQFLLRNGFEGTYPDFKRFEKMKGLVSFSSDGFTSNIAYNQNSYQFISIQEGFYDEALFITLLLDNALPAKKQFIPYNMFSCWFIDPKKNKWTDRQYVNYFTAVTTPLPEVSIADADHRQVDLESFLEIALKKVTFKKLDQKDNSTLHYNQIDKATPLQRVWLWGKAALIFGVGMTLFLFLLCFIGLLIAEEANWDAIFGYLKEIPWFVLIIVMALAFFTPISIINLIANRKK